MRIALVIYRADAARGGAERYTVDLASALVARGHGVTILSSDQPALPTGVEHVRLPARGWTRHKEYGAFLSALDQQLARRNYDIVHAMLPVNRCDLYHPHAGLAAETIATGHLQHAHPVRRWLSAAGNRLNAKRRRFVAVERRLLNGPHPPMVLCLSNYIKQQVRRHYPLDDARLARLFNAVDLSRFDPETPSRGTAVRRRLGIESDAVVALMIAQDFARKGLSAAIAAMSQVDDPRLRLVVVGRDDPAAYRRLARRLNVADRVHFAGATDDPVAFYQAADFFVLPTVHDPCSLVVLEALAMGLPVISTRFNGACEIMTTGQHGFVLDDPNDVPALADAMTRLLDRQQRWLQSAAVRALRPQLAYDRHIERVMEIYGAVCSP